MLPFDSTIPPLGICFEKIIQNMEKLFYTKIYMLWHNSPSQKHWNSNRYLKCPRIVSFQRNSFKGFAVYVPLGMKDSTAPHVCMITKLKLIKAACEDFSHQNQSLSRKTVGQMTLHCSVLTFPICIIC